MCVTPTSTQTDIMMPRKMQPQNPLAAAGHRSSLSAQYRQYTSKTGKAQDKRVCCAFLHCYTGVVLHSVGLTGCAVQGVPWAHNLHHVPGTKAIRPAGSWRTAKHLQPYNMCTCMTACCRKSLTLLPCILVPSCQLLRASTWHFAEKAPFCSPDQCCNSIRWALAQALLQCVHCQLLCFATARLCCVLPPATQQRSSCHD